MRERIQRNWKEILTVSSLWCALLAMSCYLPRLWLLDLMSEFTPYWLLASVLVVAAALKSKHRIATLAACLASITFGFTVYKVNQPLAEPDIQGLQQVKYTQSNLLFLNGDLERIQTSLLREDSDFIFLNEISKTNEQIIQLMDYPYSIRGSGKLNEELVLLSRYPIREEPIPETLDALHCVANVNGKDVHIFGFHPRVPQIP